MKERSRGRCCLPDTQRRAAAARAEPADLKLITRIPAEVYSYCRDNKAQRISRHPSTPPVSLRASRHDKHHQLNQRRWTETALARCTPDKRGASAAAPRVPRRGEGDAAVPETRDPSPQQPATARIREQSRLCESAHSSRERSSPQRAWEVRSNTRENPSRCTQEKARGEQGSLFCLYTRHTEAQRH